MHRVTAIVKEREKIQFPSEFSEIEFKKDDALRFALDDDFNGVDINGVSFSALKNCYLAIIKSSINGFFCHASQKYIAKISRLSLSTVGRCITVLRRSGRIHVTHNYKRSDDNQARRIVSFMTMPRFGRFCKNKLNQCYETAQLLKNSLSVKVASLFHISSNNGEFKASKWEFIRDFTDRTGLSAKYLYRPAMKNVN